MDVEDILGDSLEFLGGKPVIDDEVIRYGPLELTIAPKSGKANTLLADHLFSPSIYLAERIEQSLLDVRGKNVLELGAGVALPSLLLSISPNPPALLVVTDYPDDSILKNLEQNVQRNKHLVNPACMLMHKGYAWGEDPTPLLSLLPEPSPGYDALILSDLLHFDGFQDILISSVVSLLKRSPDSRIHVSAGSYTKTEVIESFLSKVRAAGFDIDEVRTDMSEGWKGTMTVTLDRESLALRKSVCRYWIGRWSAGSLL
ncbi:hypothetical protein CC1G_15186 [Coprinopsis cinerea okayama7|uniref:Nicotinamide N-methyltransferase n=1 Tax=Coprinopsis cinerea (strain Okayama-7 / 130 / ATCC MYA-4618 / FGSC 9003) TaxID=240176 RepID=D6RPN5_COPC7|nr:hypothetical protein CC1G_15186 [Coprinopsis cinerea okayama7\|eukprot:XP_002910549.1 hypothetical protein CC1G_15186 [Coprinopsis cinerea okayama7\